MTETHIPRVILAKGEGQLGNRLFQAATFLGASYEVGFECWNPALGDYAEFFPAIAGDAFCRPGCAAPKSGHRRWWCRWFALMASKGLRPLVSSVGGGVLDITTSTDAVDGEYDLCGEDFHRRLVGRRFLIVKGWKYRAHAALRAHADKIREVFRLKDSIQREVVTSVEQARGNGDLLIGVHVRRGDYAGWLGGKHFFGLESYARWMREAVAMYAGRRVAFLICSNEDVGPLLEMEGVSAKMGPGSAVGDLYALAGCDLLMGPPSTFSLWASFMGNVRLHMLLEPGQSLYEGGFVIHERV